MSRPAAPPELSRLDLAGTPREMGRAHGEAWRECIHEVCEHRLEVTIRFGGGHCAEWTRDTLLAAMEPFVAAQAAWSPAVHDEFLGIAEAAGVSPAALMLGNGFTDLRDYAARRAPDAGECTTFTALPEATADGALYLGQTWDMDQHMLPHVFVCRREPRDGPATLGVTTCGCLSLIGLNQHGVAIGNSNLRATDARVGVHYLAVIHQALAQSSLAAAAEVVRGAPRVSGHHYYLADAALAVHLETTAERCVELARDADCHVHSNDYRDAGNRALGMAIDPLGRSIERRCALSAALAAGPPSLESLQRGLEHPEVAVREPVLSSLTCAAVVMRPASRELWATHGAPEPGGWRRHAL